jgi:hypothetical protein
MAPALSSTPVKDALLLVGVIQDFRHESGDRLLESFRERQPERLAATDAKEEGFEVTILANACATTDERMEKLALEYAERIVGALVEVA